MQLSMRSNRLLVAELAIAFGFAAIIVRSMILFGNVMHFHQIFLNYYADGTMDFSADVTGLVRGLGVVNLLTLIFGLVLGVAVGLTLKSPDPIRGLARGASNLTQYERALADSGLVRITQTQEGTTHEITERGRRFLLEYADLQRRLQEKKESTP
jgi:hypothetical protein